MKLSNPPQMSIRHSAESWSAVEFVSQMLQRCSPMDRRRTTLTVACNWEQAMPEDTAGNHDLYQVVPTHNHLMGVKRVVDKLAVHEFLIETV